jgi:hypothetical protein
VCHRCAAVVGDTPKILRKITGVTLDESLTMTHNKTIGRVIPQHEVAAEMTDGRDKQRTITALPPQAVTDPPRVGPPRARSLEVTSCSLSQLRAAQARSPPRSQSWPIRTVCRTASPLLSVRDGKKRHGR